MNFVPKVMPINELKNTGNISRICKESNVPIIITKNGYGDMVLMNIEFYESLIEKINTIIYDKLKYAIEYRYGRGYSDASEIIIKSDCIL